MNRQITFDTLDRYTYTNLDLLTDGFLGIVVEFFGLGYTRMLSEPNEKARFFAEKKVLYVFPYNEPWNWMNRRAVAYTDEILDVILTHFKDKSGIPLTVMGGSMGGLCALTYTAYTSHKPKACVCNCPVCDLVAHYSEREDLPRTLYSAFSGYDCDMREALCSASPIHLLKAGRLPRIPYTIFHCEEDSAVNIALHTERFRAAAKDRIDLSVIRVPGRDHCDLGEEYTPLYLDTVIRGLGV